MYGFAYKNKQSSTFYFKVELDGIFNYKGINYTIKYLGNTNKPLNTLLYRSEVINPKFSSNPSFKIAKIPDI